jgi:hypothetical protein
LIIVQHVKIQKYHAFNESFPNKEYKPTILAEQREKENGFEN